VTSIHADIDALKGLHEALVRFRYAQRGVAERDDGEIEMTRASLAAKASRWQARLEQHQAELEACRAGGGEAVPDCSAYARAVEQAGERLEHIRRWQQRVDTEAGEFGGTASGFRDLLEVDLPRAESQLLASISRLEAARRVPAGEALPPCTPGRTAKGMSSSACSAPPGRRRSRTGRTRWPAGSTPTTGRRWSSDPAPTSRPSAR
jgi:hypothetical protein